MEEQNKTIRIECEGKEVVNIHDLHPFQGALKELSEKDYAKLKESIVSLGFSDPFSVWRDPASNLSYVHDGHERLITLLKMESEGYTIPLLPASIIIARNKTEAKKKLLANDSSYGKITQEGLYEFVHEEGFELNEDELSSFVAIDAFDYEQTPPLDVIEKPTKEPKENDCPTCFTYHASNHQTS